MAGGHPQLSIDTQVAPRESLQINVVGIPPPNELVDYRERSLEQVYRDLEDDLLNLKLAPAKDLSQRLDRCIHESPAKKFHLFTTYAAAFAPFTTDPLSPSASSTSSSHLLDTLPGLLHSLMRPPLYPPRIEKLLLLRTIVVEFQRVSVARYFDRVQRIVSRLERDLNATSLQPPPQEGLSRRHSLRLWPFKRKHKQPQTAKRGWDVGAVEQEAAKFAHNELVRFVGVFRFVVGLQAPKVEDALIRFLEPDEDELGEALSHHPGQRRSYMGEEVVVVGLDSTADGGVVNGHGNGVAS